MRGKTGLPAARTVDAAKTEAENLLRRHLENPFLVLGLPADATAAAVERRGETLLSMLGAGLPEAARYATPLGPRPRTPELVRGALAELRDPERRLGHQFWVEGWVGAMPDDGAVR
jgi:hypothetical protein